MTSHANPAITLDQQVALKTASTRLQQDFAGIYGAETLERFLHSSYDEFVGRATMLNFLPLLVERFAKQRLQAMARIEGHVEDAKPVVLFLCVHNAGGRSQMALGFFNHHAAGTAVAWSGGSEPCTEVNPSTVAAMAERGIDISGEFPQALDRRGRARRGRRDHHGLWGRPPDLPGKEVRGLGARGPGRDGGRGCTPAP